MELVMGALAALSVWAVAATVKTLVRDGYRPRAVDPQKALEHGEVVEHAHRPMW